MEALEAGVAYPAAYPIGSKPVVLCGDEDGLLPRTTPAWCAPVFFDTLFSSGQTRAGRWWEISSAVLIAARCVCRCQKRPSAKSILRHASRCATPSFGDVLEPSPLRTVPYST